MTLRREPYCPKVNPDANLKLVRSGLTGKFLWDDEDFVYKNIFVRNISLFPYSLDKNLITGAGKVSDYYRPLLLLSFAIDWQIWQGNPFGFHLTNIIFHAAATVFVFILLTKIFHNRLVSFLTAGFFALHPVQTEAVTYISGRGDPLAATFLLGSFILYLQSTQRRSQSYVYLLSLAAFAASLLARETALIGPLLLGLIEPYRQNRSLNRKALGKISGRLWPYFAIAAGYFLLRFTKLNFANILNFYNEDNLYTRHLAIRLYTFAEVLITYFKLLIFPKDLYMERTVPIITHFWAQPVVLVLLFLSIYLLISYRWRRQYPMLFFAFGWFLICLLPTSGIIPINGIIYEHFSICRFWARFCWSVISPPNFTAGRALD